MAKHRGLEHQRDSKERTGLLLLDALPRPSPERRPSCRPAPNCYRPRRWDYYRSRISPRRNPWGWATGPRAWPQLICFTPVDLACRSNRIANAAELKPQGAGAVLPALMNFDCRVIVTRGAKSQRDRWSLAHLQ